jgi:hypothetical protein
MGNARQVVQAYRDESMMWTERFPLDFERLFQKRFRLSVFL